MRKILLVGVCGLILVLVSGMAQAASVTFTQVKAVVGTPSAAEIRIVSWAKTGETSTIDSRIIDFNTGATGQALPGRSSVDETAVVGKPSDGYTALDRNVGFDAVCIGPATTAKFYIRSGELTGANGTIKHSVTYTPPGSTTPQTVNYFGCSVSRDVETSLTFEGAHWTTDQSVGKDPIAGRYGHVYHVYNWLNIPANIPPGTYTAAANYVVSYY